MTAFHRSGLSGSCASFLIAILASIAGCSEKQSAPPSIYITPTVVDFGLLTNEQYVEGVYEVANTTDSPVEIINTEVSCGCTELHLSQRTIPVGDSIELRLHADVQGRYGKQDFEAILITNSRVVPALKATLSGRLVTDEISGMKLFEIGSFLPGTDIDEVIRVPRGEASDIKIAKVKPEGKLTLKAEVSKQVGDFWECRLTGRAPLIDGPFSALVVLEADELSDWKAQTLKVRGNTQSRWRYEVEHYLGFVSPETQLEKRIEIEDRYIGSIVSNTNPVVDASIVSTTGPFVASVVLEETPIVLVGPNVNKDSPPGSIQGSVAISLSTRDHSTHHIEFKLNAYVLAQ